MTYQVTVTADGMIALPEGLRCELGVLHGGSLILERKGSRLMLQPNDPAAALQRLRDGLKGYSVDQFLHERRADWSE